MFTDVNSRIMFYFRKLYMKLAQVIFINLSYILFLILLPFCNVINVLCKLVFYLPSTHKTVILVSLAKTRNKDAHALPLPFNL